ncbi:MAG: hypothetical protein KAG96_00790 [Ichthyobacteriaceae bacterium]|nr:hypothetical protein [Ichthyobacteriaceae bacterium]
MSTQKYVSQVKTVNWSNDVVYDRLSNLETLKHIFNEDNLERAKQHMGDKADKFKLDDFRADADTCSFNVDKVGRIGLRIIEREDNKTIKVASDGGTPINFMLWIQILPLNQGSCKVRLTLHTELNMMMKMMLGKKLSKGIDQVADGFAQIPFGNLPSSNM